MAARVLAVSRQVATLITQEVTAVAGLLAPAVALVEGRLALRAMAAQARLIHPMPARPTTVRFLAPRRQAPMVIRVLSSILRTDAAAVDQPVTAPRQEPAASAVNMEVAAAARAHRTT